MRRKIDYSVIASFGFLVITLAFFTIMSKGNMISAFNIKAILDQTVIVVVAGLGVIFVVAQGGADLSIGTTVGLTTVGGAVAAVATGHEWLLLPVSVVIAIAQGALNGVLVAKLRVPSFMVTLAMLIGIRGLVKFIQVRQPDLYYIGPVIGLLRNTTVKYTFFVVLIIIAYYVLAHTKFGEYCKAIGENEAVAYSVGLPVQKIKIAAFIIASFMACVAGWFTLAKVGGTNMTMGINLEIDVLMGIFFGGVLVTGGYGTKISKLLIGSFTISIIKNGMILIRITTISASEFTQGILLMIILFLTIQISKNRDILFGRRKEKTEEESLSDHGTRDD
jgi:ribose transport system permease protein